MILAGVNIPVYAHCEDAGGTVAMRRGFTNEAQRRLGGAARSRHAPR